MHQRPLFCQETRPCEGRLLDEAGPPPSQPTVALAQPPVCRLVGFALDSPYPILRLDLG